MTRATLGAVLHAAGTGGYAVPAINVVDVTTMDGVLRAADRCRSPIIVQTAARTAMLWGPRVLAAAFTELATRCSTPAVLQLDHCSDRGLVDACLEAGWDAVLFDGSGFAIEHNITETRAVVRRAHELGAAVEGELESIRGKEEGASIGALTHASVSQQVEFIRETGVDCYAPSIGNVHGRTAGAPEIDIAAVRQLAAAWPIAIALHGGTGIPDDSLRQLIAAGCVKVNVSTALREACVAALRHHVGLESDTDDPVPILEAVRAAAEVVAAATMNQLGSIDRA
jgi:ketose-bisphosphate aldolase